MGARVGSRLRAGFTAIAVACAAGTCTAGLPDSLVADRLGRERGFPSETITALHRDRTGFLWVGSREGLAVFDGYDVRTFQHNVDDPGSLSDDAIRRIYEDRSGRLWVGTDAGGLQVLDRATWRFETYRHDPADPHSLGANGVYAIAQGDDGILWVGTQKGLDRMDIATGKFSAVAIDPAKADALPNPWVSDVHRDREGRIWATTVGGGVAWVDPASMKVTRVPFGVASMASARSALVYSIAEGPEGDLWFGAEDGVFRCAPGSTSLERVPIRELQAEKVPSIVTSVAFDGGDTLWVATWSGGLIGYDLASGESHRYRHDAARENGLATDRLSCAIVDADGNVWIGTWGRGIQEFNLQSAVFSRILERADDPTALPYHEITSVFEDRRGRLWVGTWGKGLHWRGARGEAFSPVRGDAGVLAEMYTPLVLAEDADGNIWVGTMSGLYRVGREHEVEQAFRHAVDKPDGLGAGYVNALAFDRDGRLWIGTGGGGLHRLETDRKTIVHFRNDPHDPTSLSDDIVTSLLLDTKDRIWVGTKGGGLNVLDVATGRFTRFVPDPKDPRSLPHHTVTSILEDRRGRIWAGTAGGGLARIENGPSGDWIVTRVGIAEGLVSSSVVSIREDDDGSLWIGTRRGLSRYKPGTGAFHNYGPGDGLPSLEFRANASAAGATQLYFGTLGGILSIARGSSFTPGAATPTLITAIRSIDGPWPTAVPAWTTQSIEAPYGSLLSFEFGVLDLRPPHRFAYRLDGDGESWIDLGARRDVTFVGLSPGTHMLSVRGLNARGVWSESTSPLTLRILPPFWMTWWFRGAIALSIVAGSWAWIHVRVRSLERRNRELEALHRERETALQQARSSEEQLHGAYARLRTLTRRLEAAKEEERRWIARELHDEMGQALSAVKINLKALGRLSEGETASERVADALTLIDGIIGHVRTLSLDLRPPLLDELGLVVALRGYAEGQSVRAGLEISVEANTGAEDVPADIAIAAFRIVQESIHNVIRHAHARSVTVSIRRDPRRLSLAVHDDGGGFDLTEALERAASGRHLGLLGMRERIEALGGTFEVETRPGKGTALHATIPLADTERAS